MCSSHHGSLADEMRPALRFHARNVKYVVEMEGKGKRSKQTLGKASLERKPEETKRIAALC